MSLLDIQQLTLRFGGLTAVKDFSLRVNKHEIVSIIGPNGAGKTTVFNAVTGIYLPTTGEIKLAGEVIARPYSWRMWLACLAVGLITALGVGLISINIDLLWRAAVRRPFNMEQFYRTGTTKVAPPEKRFTYTTAFANALSYVRGDLAVEPVLVGG